MKSVVLVAFSIAVPLSLFSSFADTFDLIPALKALAVSSQEFRISHVKQLHYDTF